MIYRPESAVDANWRELVILGQPVPCKKTEFSAKRNVEVVYRSGSDSVAAYTFGTNEVEDSTIEFDYMGAVKFLAIFGVNDFNPTLTSFAGLSFEMLERVNDPRPITGVVLSAGGHSNIAKGCEVIGFKWGFEQGPGVATTSITVKIKRLEMHRGAAGGGFTLGLAQ